MAAFTKRLVVGFPLPLALPMEIDRRIRAFDEDPVNAEIHIDAIVNCEVALDFQLEPTETVERHQQLMKRLRVFMDVGLAELLDRLVNLSHLRRIARQHAARLGTTHGANGHQSKHPCADQAPAFMRFHPASIACCPWRIPHATSA